MHIGQEVYQLCCTSDPEKLYLKLNENDCLFSLFSYPEASLRCFFQVKANNIYLANVRLTFLCKLLGVKNQENTSVRSLMTENSYRSHPDISKHYVDQSVTHGRDHRTVANPGHQLVFTQTVWWDVATFTDLHVSYNCFPTVSQELSSYYMLSVSQSRRG